MKSPMIKKNDREQIAECSQITCGDSSCCGGSVNKKVKYEKNPAWKNGKVETSVGPVSVISTKLSKKDILGAWKVRWGFGRMNYRIKPGLYAVGNPTDNSPALVTANYKLTFDRLRQELSGLDAWILVLDTKGINVWCAAGKGTFGTEEIIRRIHLVNLDRIVKHRNIILPQLGAPGVAAHEVGKSTGFKVTYGPVRASDLPAFLKAGMQQQSGMRRVKFTFRDRLALVGVDLVRPSIIMAAVFALMLLFRAAGIHVIPLREVFFFGGAVLSGAVLAPLILPWLPGRSFAFKGWQLGILWVALIYIYYFWIVGSPFSWEQMIAYLLTLPALSAFLTLNFTGSTTFTSFSGVVKEMMIAIPVIVVSFGAGSLVWVAMAFIKV